MFFKKLFIFNNCDKIYIQVTILTVFRSTVQWILSWVLSIRRKVMGRGRESKLEVQGKVLSDTRISSYSSDWVK